ncbi:MAG: PAS domain S-box protein, partial [Planctomycetota bacterium]
MSRMLVVERDAARRDGLVSALTNAGFRAKAVSLAEVAGQLASHRVELLLVGDGDLRLLDDLPRNGDEFTVPVLTLIDLGNVSGILASLSAGASGFLSRDSSSEQIVAKVKSLLRSVDPNDSDPHQITILGDGTLTERTYRLARLVEALEAVCDDIRTLQLRYEEEQLQRRKVEQALMESEAFYQSLVETLPMAMFRKDLQGHVTFANRLLCEAFCRPSEEIIGRTDYDFFPRDLAEKYRIDDRRVVETRQNFETTEEFQAQDGERRFTHVVKTPVYDASGNPVGVQGIFSDVTDKERAKIELSQTKTRLQAVLDAATQMSVIATDVNGLIDVFNTGAARMLGYTAEEMIGKQTPAIIHLESEVRKRGEEMSQQFGHSFQGIDVFVEYARRGQHEEREWTYVRKDGSHLTVNLIVTARRDRDGQIEGFLGIATDISARKKAEEAMRKAKEA